jgi:hypothetical protein
VTYHDPFQRDQVLLLAAASVSAFAPIGPRKAVVGLAVVVTVPLRQIGSHAVTRWTRRHWTRRAADHAWNAWTFRRAKQSKVRNMRAHLVHRMHFSYCVRARSVADLSTVA